MVQSNKRLSTIVRDTNYNWDQKLNMLKQDTNLTERDTKQLLKLQSYLNTRLDNNGTLLTHTKKVLDAVERQSRNNNYILEK